MTQKGYLWLVLSACFVFLWACISFKIPALPLPENSVESIDLCKKIEIRGDLLSPVETSTVFSPIDNIVDFIRLRNVLRKIQLRWKWYAPDQILARDSGNVIVNAEEKNLDVVTASDPLRPSSPEKKEGDWTVCVFINDALACVQKFVIKK
jgi:hypothetical protein